MPRDALSGKALVQGVGVNGQRCISAGLILIAMSRATFDLTIAGRLRRMATELQDKATEQDEVAFPELAVTKFKQSA
jgi:hypothetical protein